MRLILLTAALLAPASGAAACAWPSPATVLKDGPVLSIRVWEGDVAALEAAAGAAPPALAAFRAWASARTDTDAYALLRRQHALYVRLKLPDAEKVRLILGNNVGRIAPMNCLETLLFADHQARFPVQGYTEFVALALKKDGRLRVYSMSGGLGNGTGPSFDNIRANVEADRAAGWAVELNLHNHPFNFDNPSGDIGATLVPSGAAAWGDLGNFARQNAQWDLAVAAITNGFDTVRLSRADVARLAALP